ncbi:MAG: hypothetical protein AAFN93_27760, partial [Bacteroidota bacterium]
MSCDPDDNDGVDLILVCQTSKIEFISSLISENSNLEENATVEFLYNEDGKITNIKESITGERFNNTTCNIESVDYETLSGRSYAIAKLRPIHSFEN